MPLPTPNDGEDQQHFMDRCLANQTVNDDFPDDAQRFAVCQRIWSQNKTANEINEIRKRSFTWNMGGG